MPTVRRAFIGWAVLMIMPVACSQVTPSTTSAPPAPPPAPSPSSTAPFFQIDPGEAKTYRALAREQDLHLATCAQEHSCDQAHFSRALLALFENQRTATKHFQDVLTATPKSRLAAASSDWLKLLQETPPDNERHSHLARVTQNLILELVNREQAAKEELSARDKKLEELSNQLERLKLIDQEMNEKAHRLRPRARTPQGASEPAEMSK